MQAERAIALARPIRPVSPQRHTTTGCRCFPPDLLNAIFFKSLNKKFIMRKYKKSKKGFHKKSKKGRGKRLNTYTMNRGGGRL